MKEKKKYKRYVVFNNSMFSIRTLFLPNNTKIFFNKNGNQGRVFMTHEQAKRYICNGIINHIGRLQRELETAKNILVSVEMLTEQEH